MQRPAHRAAPAMPPAANSGQVPGRHALDSIRRYVERDKKRLTLLLGAFRNQAVRPLYRFADGHGSFSGPYYGLDQPSDKLNLDQFRNALMQLLIHLPDSETEGLFAVMADGHGLLGIGDLLREIKADPCDAAGRWSRSSKVVGQHGPDKGVPRTDHVFATKRSGYSGHHWRAAPPAPTFRPPPQAPEKENSWRVAPTNSGPYVDGANVLRSHVSMGGDTANAHPKPSWRKPPPRPPVTMHPRRVPSAYAHEAAVHVSDPDPAGDATRWQSDKIGHRRAPPRPPVFAGRVAPSMSGYTHTSSIFIGGEPEVEPAPPVEVEHNVLPTEPYVSGYNRGERRTVGVPEAWVLENNSFERPGPPERPPQPDAVVAPTPNSGFTYADQSQFYDNDIQARKCAFCRLHG